MEDFLACLQGTWSVAQLKGRRFVDFSCCLRCVLFTAILISASTTALLRFPVLTELTVPATCKIFTGTVSTLTKQGKQAAPFRYAKCVSYQVH